MTCTTRAILSAGLRRFEPNPTRMSAAARWSPVFWSTTQWAAVTTVVVLVRVPPQNCAWKAPSSANRSARSSEARYGYWSAAPGSPLITRGVIAGADA